MTHTEESLMALVGEWRAHWGCGDIEDSCEIALRLAIREVLAERDMHKDEAEAQRLLRQQQRERAEKAEAERERLRKLLAEMRNDWARSADPSGEAWVIEIDAAMKEQP